jgi:hypothetical protein
VSHAQGFFDPLSVEASASISTKAGARGQAG